MNLHLILVTYLMSSLNLSGVHQRVILLFLSKGENELFKITDKELGYSNSTSEEWKAMRSLADDKQIVIKKADKGSCVVVWDRDDYLLEAERQLKDEKIYKSVTFN